MFLATLIRPPVALRRPRPRPLQPPTAAPAADDAPPPGCGWFDSSHELQAGLQVTEHASPDAVAAELPLTHWLDLQLAGWRPPLPR